MTAPQLSQADLDQFHGSETLYYHPLLPRLRYTEGVRYMARRAEAYWLLDAVFSYQTLPKVQREPFQVWKLTAAGSEAVLTCTDGNSDTPIVTQNIPYTDFPLDEVTVWLEDGVLMLPSER